MHRDDGDERLAGEDLIEAAVHAGRLRLRPILMTTMTTVLGMVPLALGIGDGAETWAPMARAVIGGLTVSTLLTLVVVPAAYVTLAGIIDRRRAKKRPAKPTSAGSPPGGPAFTSVPDFSDTETETTG